MNTRGSVFAVLPSQKKKPATKRELIKLVQRGLPNFSRYKSLPHPAEGRVVPWYNTGDQLSRVLKCQSEKFYYLCLIQLRRSLAIRNYRS